MEDLHTLPYAEWLEKSLQKLVSKPVKSICILAKFDTDEVDTSYYNFTVADTLIFAGYLQQDAMLEALKFEGYLKADEEDLEDD